MCALRPSCLSFPVMVWLGLAVVACAPSQAQSRTPGKVARKAGGNAKVGGTVTSGGRFRATAPGVEVTIPVENEKAATFSRHDMVEVLAVDPTFGERPAASGLAIAKDVVFEHEIYMLEITLKPMRMVFVDIPNTEGRFDRKQIWYLLYRVKNTGKVWKHSFTDGTATSVEVNTDKPIRFIPRITLETWVSGKETRKIYPDRLIPVAIPEIEKREDAGRRLKNVAEVVPEPAAKLHNTIEMMRDIPPSPEGQDLSVWGVATWEDIDPTTDHFSVFIQGLTNAYRWEDAKAGEPPAYVYKPGDPLGKGRKRTQKTLRLNFWRPSDRYDEHEEEIRFGYWKHSGEGRFDIKPEERVDYLWLYR
jgi:hypothetical protein